MRNQTAAVHHTLDSVAPGLFIANTLC